MASTRAVWCHPPLQHLGVSITLGHTVPGMKGILPGNAHRRSWLWTQRLFWIMHKGDVSLGNGTQADGLMVGPEDLSGLFQLIYSIILWQCWERPGEATQLCGTSLKQPAISLQEISRAFHKEFVLLRSLLPLPQASLKDCPGSQRQTQTAHTQLWKQQGQATKCIAQSELAFLFSSF